MRIEKALPLKRYLAAAKHAQSREFLQLRDSTIATLKSWWLDPRVNLEKPPSVMFGYGKDGMALMLLLRLAGLDFTALFVNNRGDVPAHDLIFPEFDRWYGEYKRIEYRTELRYIDYIQDGLEWGRIQNFKKKDGTPIDFFEWGAMAAVIAHNVSTRFYWQYTTDDYALRLWGNRAGEGMERAYEISRRGLLSVWGEESANEVIQMRGLPIGKWKDMDVWALLVSEHCPVSPVYAMNALPQKPGRGAFPRTLRYCAPELFSSTFYKWLAYYAPGPLKEMLDIFPEIQQRLDMMQAGT